MNLLIRHWEEIFQQKSKRIGLELYITDLAFVGIARHFEQQRDSSRRLDSANGKRLLFALLKQHTHQGCVVPVHIGRRNRPAGLFCVVLVTLGRGSLPFARRSSPALRPSNNFADTKTPKTSAMELNRRMCTCFPSLLLSFVSLVLILCFRHSSRLQSSWQYFRSPSLSRNSKAFGINHLGGGGSV